MKKMFFSALKGEKEVWEKNPSSAGRVLVVLSAPFVIALSLMLSAMGVE